MSAELAGARGRNSHRAVALLAFLLMACAFASARAADLLGVWRLAQQQDAEYAAARHAFEAAGQKLPQARAALLPSVNLSANASAQSGASAFGDASPVARGAHSSALNLQLAQTIWRPERLRAFDQAAVFARQAQAQLRVAQQDLVLRVAQAYFDVLVAQQTAEVALAQLKALAAQLRLAQRNFEVGTGTITETYEAKSRFDLARAQRVGALAELENRRAELERMLGTLPALAGLRPDMPLSAAPQGQVEAWMERARQDHPKVHVQQAALAAAELEIARQEAGTSPSVEFTAGGGRNFSAGSLSTLSDAPVRSRSVQVGLQLNLPLYDGGATQSRVREAIAQRDRAESELLAARRQAAAQARQAWAGALQGEVQAEALASAVASSQSAVEASRIGYRIGTRINLDVLNAEQQLFAARRDLYKARAETILHGLRLKAADGSLQAADLEGVNALLVDTPTPPEAP